MMGGAIKNTPSLLSLTFPFSLSASVQSALTYHTHWNSWSFIEINRFVSTCRHYFVIVLHYFYDLNKMINMFKLCLHSCIFKKHQQLITVTNFLTVDPTVHLILTLTKTCPIPYLYSTSAASVLQHEQHYLKCNYT